MTTICYTHPASHRHLTPEGHPERVERAAAVEAALDAIAVLQRAEAPDGRAADILRAHPRRYLDALEAALPEEGRVMLDADTHMSPGSLAAARHAVGGACAAVDAVLSGEAANAFVGCRPPGHHAERETAMGFCLFGTAAIAALRALDHHGLARVAVVDFDVHHGNGTQDILWNEGRALFLSSHQMPLYPGTGAASERGGHDNVANHPLDTGSGGAEMRAAWGDHLLPRLRDFAPELIIVSAGFDAHRDDPLAGLTWEEEDFRWLTGAICDVAEDVCGGRVVSTLEGGYDLQALGASVAADVETLKERGA
jgi:acetoin utilization deacetylase AcuC-like enzyme